MAVEPFSTLVVSSFTMITIGKDSLVFFPEPGSASEHNINPVLISAMSFTKQSFRERTKPSRGR